LACLGQIGFLLDLAGFVVGQDLAFDLVIAVAEDLGYCAFGVKAFRNALLLVFDIVDEPQGILCFGIEIHKNPFLFAVDEGARLGEFAGGKKKLVGALGYAVDFEIDFPEHLFVLVVVGAYLFLGKRAAKGD
jgi:hypothetical protein